MTNTVIEVTLQLDLGPYAPGDPLSLARALAVELSVAAEEAAINATEVAGPEEVRAPRPQVRYRVDGGEWHDASDDPERGF